MPADELGEFLRRKGVHEAQLAEWRAAATAALRPPSKRDRRAASVEARRVRDLERELARKEKALAEAAALLVLKKSPGDLGGRGRRHGPGERRMIRDFVAQAVAAGARRWRACEVLGLTVRTLERWGDRDDD